LEVGLISGPDDFYLGFTSNIEKIFHGESFVNAEMFLDIEASQLRVEFVVWR
jgi:hypothetical protein